MSNNRNINQLRDQGWEEMANLLDTHMPVERKRPVWIYYAMAGAAAIALMIFIFWPSTVDQINSQSSMVITAPSSGDHPSEHSNKPKTSDSISDVVSTNPASIDHPDNYTETSPDSPHNSVIALSADPKASFDLVKERTEDVPVDSESARNEPSQTNSSFSFSETAGHLTSRSLKYAVVKLENPTLYISAVDQSSTLNDLPVPTIDVVSQNKGKIQIGAFSEMMWSLSDRFGFFNAGPSVGFKKGKWTLGLSGGIAIPIPQQKTFDDSNLNFSNQYNFHQGLSKELFFDFASTANQKFVYYENYTMKPGFKFDVFVQAQLSANWNLMFDMGRIGYRWDFSQKAVPNQMIAARTDLTNLKNEMWYGGVVVGYNIGNHWMIYGGFRMINPGDLLNLGLMPALRIGYNF